jgi:hypothetical protein
MGGFLMMVWVCEWIRVQEGMGGGGCYGCWVGVHVQGGLARARGVRCHQGSEVGEAQSARFASWMSNAIH